MSAETLSERYGRALLILAGEHSLQRRVADELKALAALIGRMPILKDSLADPTIPTAAKQAILDEIMTPVFAPLTRSFIGLLTGNRRAGLLEEIVKYLDNRLDAEAGNIKVRVESALPMTGDDRAAILRRLTQRLKKKVHLEIAVVPELLAGITVRIGDCLIDGSCRGRLARMRQVLMA